MTQDQALAAIERVTTMLGQILEDMAEGNGLGSTISEIEEIYCDATDVLLYIDNQNG